MAIGSKDSHG
ncbi:Protein of unknown function [Propionibacterium freudenreichii]|nr:Protein of unknown function [Propionibacterium freudenreichii subsp. freudenreichii]CEG89445.1 Protein of unknown function [Propionibacterium freudenreichii]CEG92573.1 Protein of unknown function [Propionibacterium freudenreichii]CEG95460.1 Protein of unknown function [Propionibacterium freudenreichii]CEG97479.1 Protein of unknown function [Propionibacterium freudenreichii]